jgi:hypothetical protein
MLLIESAILASCTTEEERLPYGVFFFFSTGRLPGKISLNLHLMREVYVSLFLLTRFSGVMFS